MSSTIEQRAFELFDELCDLPESQRAALLEVRCEAEPEVREIVERMLREDATSDEATELYPGGGARLVAASMFTDDTGALPEHIGRYRVIREIGRGGMGVVFEAEQEEPRRRVALKVMREGFASYEVRRRFRRESHLLGQLQHRGIAHVYEAGTATIGHSSWPFFAMEFIDGLHIDRHAEQHSLDLRQRMELVARVADAIQHAHVKGVLHRDLKMANVLVVSESGTGTGSGDSTVTDDIGQPKVLDFGVARLSEHDQSISMNVTRAGQMIGTLAYMSPEQFSGGVEGVDTRTDVYSLGVILYALLCRRLPHDLHGLGIGEAARVIRDVDPPRLGAIAPRLRGDISTIAAKAMAKDPERRYVSAAAFADDLRRFLRDEPIVARRSSTLYHVRKFAQRNRALVGGAAATLLVLVAGLIVSLILLNRVSRERREATVAQEQATLIGNFQNEMLRVINLEGVGEALKASIRDQLATSNGTPGLADDIDQRLNGVDLARVAINEAILNSAVARLDAGVVDDPLAEAALRTSISTVYRSLFMYRAELVQRERATTLLREHLGVADAATFNAMVLQAEVLHGLFRYDEAADLLEEVIGHGRSIFNARDPILLHANVSYADALIALSRFDEANDVLSEQLALVQGMDSPNVAMTFLIESRMAALHLNMGSYEQAAEMYSRVIAQLRERAGDRDTPQMLGLLQNAALALVRLGRFEEAEAYYRRLIDGWSAARGEDHEATIVNRLEFARFLRDQRRVDESLPVLRTAYRSSVHGLAPGRIHRADVAAALSATLIDLGELDECMQVLDEAIRTRVEIAGILDTATAELYRKRGLCLQAMGREAEAAEAFAEAQRIGSLPQSL